MRAYTTGGTGSGTLQLRLNDNIVATWNVPNNGTYANYTHNGITGSPNVKVYFVDNNGTDARVDYIVANGTTIQAESRSSNTAVWQNGTCGGSLSEWMHCPGHIDFGTINFGSSSSSSSSSSSGGTLNLTATADKDTQGTNSGTAAIINTSQWNLALFKFSLSSVGTVSNAKLRVYKPASTSAANFSVFKGSSDSWTEASGTTTETGSALQTVNVGTAAQWIEFTVTTAVQQEASGDDVATFVIKTDQGGWIQLNARESSTNKPTLVVTP